MKKYIFIIASIALLAVGGGVYWFVHQKNTPSGPSTQSKINYGPPTPQEKADSQAHKQASVGSSATSTQNTSAPSGQSPKTRVSPHITTYTQTSTDLAVNGFVEGVVEDGGTCTLTLTKQGVTVTQSRQGTANATNTTCGQIDVPLSKLSSGTWQAVLSYSSNQYQGSSTAMNIPVQ